jgi:2-amino-4-hydroxy-6-hydroxymethyldihydropteridine diphosphokinase
MANNSTVTYASLAIGMGTSMEPRKSNLARGTRELVAKVFTNNIQTKMSSWYHSRACVPWGSKDLRPIEYINCMVTGSTFLPPVELLRILKEIEISFGRDIHAQRWSPRPIDLDIVVYNNEPFEDVELTIPHPRAIERIWVLAPLHEVWPNAYVHHAPCLPSAIKSIPNTTNSEPPAPTSTCQSSQTRTDIDVTTILEYYAGETTFEKITPAPAIPARRSGPGT